MSIVLSLDEHHIQGLATLLRSLWQHTPYVEQLKVYIIAIDMSSDTLLSYLACHHISTHQVYYPTLYKYNTMLCMIL